MKPFLHKTLGILTLAFPLAFVGLATPGCEEWDNEPEVIDNVEDAGDEVGDAIEDAGQEAREAAEDAADETGDAINN